MQALFPFEKFGLVYEGYLENHIGLAYMVFLYVFLIINKLRESIGIIGGGIRWGFQVLKKS